MRTLIDALAYYAHDAWSGWMKYLFNESIKNEDGTITIPVFWVERWKRQMNTDYYALPEKEKESDIIEAERMLRIILEHEWSPPPTSVPPPS